MNFYTIFNVHILPAIIIPGSMLAVASLFGVPFLTEGVLEVVPNLRFPDPSCAGLPDKRAPGVNEIDLPGVKGPDSPMKEMSSFRKSSSSSSLSNM